MNDFFKHLTGETDAMVIASFMTLAVAHAVNTFPVPDNKYGRWLLGCVQWVFAFKGRAENTFKNTDTVTVPVPKKGTGAGQDPVA